MTSSTQRMENISHIEKLNNRNGRNRIVHNTIAGRMLTGCSRTSHMGVGLSDRFGSNRVELGRDESGRAKLDNPVYTSDCGIPANKEGGADILKTDTVFRRPITVQEDPLQSSRCTVPFCVLYTSLPFS